MFKLQDIRTFNFIRWGAYIFFPVIIISFVFFYGWQGPTQQDTDVVYGEVEVNGEIQKITSNQLMRIEDQLLQQKVGLLPAQTRNFLMQQPNLLRGLVSMREQVRAAANDLLLSAAAQNMDIELNEQTIVDQLSRQPNITDEALTLFAQQQGFADKWALLDFMRHNQESSLASVLKTSLAHASLFEVWQEYQLSNEKIKMRIAAYPAEDYIDDVVVTQQDREDFYNENMEMFHRPKQRRYAYVNLTNDDLKAQIVPTEEQLKAFYEQNQANYAQTEAFNAEEIYIPLASSTSATTALAVLSQLRLEYQDSPTTWSQLTAKVNSKLEEMGSDLRAYFRKTPMIDRTNTRWPKTYIEEMFTLEPGQLSTPTADDTGVYLGRKLVHREGGSRSFDEVRSLVKTDYIDKQLPDLFKETAAKWEEARKDASNVREFAAKVGIEDEITTRVNATETYIPEMGVSFSSNRDYIDMLRLQELSEVIEQSGSLLVLMIVEELEDRDPPLEEVRNEVDMAVRESRALELAKAAAEQGLATIKSGANMQDALANAPLPPFETAPFSRVEPVQALGAPLVGFRSELLGLAPGKKALYPYGSSEEDAIGYAVCEVLEVKEANQEEFAKDRVMYEQQYLAVQRATIMQEWLADQRKQADFQVMAN